jgi:predicted ArsR family transcriptional regulator
MMTTARHRVLAYLMKTRRASAQDISRALKMSAATVRYHLRVLVASGRLEARTSQDNGQGRGRPQKEYVLPLGVLGDNLAALSEALLAEAGADLAMEAVAKRLAGESGFGNQTGVRRLTLVVEKLNQMNYHARWEAGSGGPRVILSHCPYAAIIERHPGLCKMDEALLKDLMGQSAEQLTKIGRDGSISCVFVIRP